MRAAIERASATRRIASPSPVAESAQWESAQVPAPGTGFPIFNLAALDHLTPCVADDDHSPAYTAETALQCAARHARERGGYTVRLDSLRAPGSAANDDPST